MQRREVPDHIVELERSMRKDYEPRYAAWQQRKAKWEAEQQRLKDVVWAKCKTPGEQAQFDLERFLNHYFLMDGKPDPTKTKEPLALYGFTARCTLHKRANEIAGLETVSGGSEQDGTRTLCIGWDRGEVLHLAQRITDEFNQQKQAKQNALWDNAMIEHRLLVKTVKENGPKVIKNSMTPKALQKCVGSYIIRCESVTDQWDVETLLTLDVGFGPKFDVMKAAFDLSVFEGTMFLALSEDKLDEIVGHSDVSDFDSDENSDEDDRESEDGYNQDTWHGRGNNTSRKRSAPVQAPGRVAKKSKTKTPARRVFVRSSGRETGEGEIYPDPEGGHLDFTDETYTAFKGEICIPFVGDKVKIEGYKVDESRRSNVEPWESFSHVASATTRSTIWF